MKQTQKIIIWGYPLHSHTHSYIHAAFYKAFKFLGYDTYWFDDKNYPQDFNWNNSIFWTEGFADHNIPINSSSVYFVHVCPHPAKYINAGVKKFIDVRYNHLWHKDHVYEYKLNKNTAIKVGNSCYYEEAKNQQIQVKNDYHDYTISDYDKFYISWATNKLPHEFDFDDINAPRKNIIHFCGNLSPNGRCENMSTFSPFINECTKNGIQFIHNDPWVNPLSEDEIIRRCKESILGVDIRGPEHLRNGYVPCRIFKSIGCGHLGITNSREVFKELDGNCLFEEDTANLFYKAMDAKNNYAFIANAMKYVKNEHTYVNRINSIMKIV